jgi:hypothetical protein
MRVRQCSPLNDSLEGIGSSPQRQNCEPLACNRFLLTVTGELGELQ